MDFERLLALLRGHDNDGGNHGEGGGCCGKDGGRDGNYGDNYGGGMDEPYASAASNYGENGTDTTTVTTSDAARKCFAEFIDRKFLWNNAFSREMQGLRRHFNDLRKEILDYTFWQVQRKVRSRDAITEDYFAGMVVNTIREGVRHYSVDAMVNVRGYDKVSLANVYRTVERSVMEGYVEGINPFDLSEEWEKQRRLDDMIAVLDSITDPCRTLVRLKYLDGLSHNDIVKRAIGYSTVESSRVKLSHCLDRMRKLYSATNRHNGEQGTHRKISRPVAHSRREGGV